MQPRESVYFRRSCQALAGRTGHGVGVHQRLPAVRRQRENWPLNQTMQYGVIMAGGAGTRLWPPFPRGVKPKQLLHDRPAAKSLLNSATSVLRGVLPPASGSFVCQPCRAHGPAVLGNLPRIDNGQPAGASQPAATRRMPSGSPRAVLAPSRQGRVFMVVTTADHVIEEVDTFQARRARRL